MSVSKIHSAVLAIAVAVVLPAASSRGAFAQSRHHAGHDRLLVMTDKGPVRGTLAQDHREFLGIPYAAPPTGELRWKAPVPHAAWTAVLDATRFGPTCAQPASAPGLAEFSSEDCLYLNIYTPNPPRRHLPVMVWIHGGTFIVGSGQETDGSVLAVKGKVVVVTINYRLGPFGFLTDKVLDAENPHHVSGNYGLLDQQAALKWVKRNIAGFGGDSARVTIFGESAGGISVALQMIAPGAAGLFARAIDESGPSQVALQPIALAQKQGDKLIATLGCRDASDVVACMRAKPTNQVLGALPATAMASGPGDGALWFPVVDGLVLPLGPDEAFKSGRFSRVPLINGSNHDEGRSWASGPLDEDGYAAAIRRRFGNNAKRVMEEYPLRTYPTPLQAWATIFTDAFFSCPIRRTTRLLAPQLSVYAYEFNNPKGPDAMVRHNGLEMRAYHGAEVLYVFPTASYFKRGVRDKWPTQLKLSEQIVSYWTRFAASGYPDGTSPKWSPYRNAQDQVLSFAPGDISYQSGFAKDHHCAFWDSLDVEDNDLE
jgi:para-nitrobenzyl esterase